MATTSDRVLGVLALFGGEKPVWTVEEAAAALGLPTSTTYRYFRSLADAGLISSQWAGAYVLGPAICALDRAMQMGDPLINAAREELEALAAAHGAVIILLARLYRDTVMCVDRAGTGLRAHGYERGRPMPLERGAASKVILAHLDARQLRRLAREPARAAELERLRDELRRIRQQGFAITRGEIDPTRIGISVPVFRNGAAVEGSLSFVIDAGSGADEMALVRALGASRETIEARLREAGSPGPASTAPAP